MVILVINLNVTITITITITIIDKYNMDGNTHTVILVL